MLCFESEPRLQAYHLPKRPEDIYHQQTAPRMVQLPSGIVFNAKKAQGQVVVEPFGRSLRKMPEDARPLDAGGPEVGPLGHPNEPVWFEMRHRLKAILDKQSRRAERRRKRRVRAKLLRGRARPPPKRDQGRELREYLDRAAAERTGGQRDAPGVPPGEFMSRVHEQYQLHRERLDMPRFRSPSAPGGAGMDRLPRPLGACPSPRAQRVVRPVYIPPPHARAEAA